MSFPPEFKSVLLPQTLLELDWGAAETLSHRPNAEEGYLLGIVGCALARLTTALNEDAEKILPEACSLAGAASLLYDLIRRKAALNALTSPDRDATE